jgi:hypothetical protein
MPVLVIGAGLLVTRRRRRKPATVASQSPNQGVAS